jgi:hypothetical protein
VDGSVHAFPVVEPEVSSAEELAAMIAHGFGVRSTGEKNLRDAFLFYRRNSTLKEIVYY